VVYQPMLTAVHTSLAADSPLYMSACVYMLKFAVSKSQLLTRGRSSTLTAHIPSHVKVTVSR